jgi:membrane-associated phospholipid phosphatase
MSSRGALAAVVAVLVCAAATPAIADPIVAGHHVDRPVDAAVTIAAIGAGLGLSLLPIREDRELWHRELFGAADGAVHDNFSRRAAIASDGLLAVSVAAPVIYLTGTTIDDADGDRMLIYSESLAVNFALFQGVKRLVQRPRPYLYSTSPEVARYANAQGDDAHVSFYSGHAATSFCAATTGAYLVAASSASRGERAAAWASGFAVAGATANLRVRAGKHFYSDVVVGAVVGIAIGYVVPALHADAGAYLPDTLDVIAAAAGLLGGVAISQLLPLGGSEAGHLGPPSRVQLHLGPAPLASGVIVSIAGTL